MKNAYEKVASQIKKKGKKFNLGLEDLETHICPELTINTFLKRRYEQREDLAPELRDLISNAIEYWCYDVFKRGSEAVHDNSDFLISMQFETVEEEEFAETFLQGQNVDIMALVQEILVNFQPCTDDYWSRAGRPIESLMLELAASIHYAWQSYGDNQNLFYICKKSQYRFVPFEVLGWNLAEETIEIARIYIDAFEDFTYDTYIVKEMYNELARTRLKNLAEEKPIQNWQVGISILARYIASVASEHVDAMQDSRYVQYYILPQLAKHGGLTEQQAETFIN